MAKKMYDESSGISPEEISKIHTDFTKLTKPFIIAKYEAIFGKLMKGKGMTTTEAHAIATCELISENNSNLLIALEDVGMKFPS